ncbi:MAG: tRNA-intron lyase [archaeon]
MPRKIIAKGKIIGQNVLVEKESEANSIYQRGFYGQMLKGGQLQMSLIEAIYLSEKSRLNVKEGKKKIKFEELLELGKKSDKNIFTKYVAYSDLRERGYLVKTGFKFGSDFRVYKRGDAPGEAHSPYMVHCVPENYKLTMTELSRLIRLGHSVKKIVWIAVVDAEGDLTYYQAKRVKP